jgi:hypothetical protein
LWWFQARWASQYGESVKVCTLSMMARDGV